MSTDSDANPVSAQRLDEHSIQEHQSCAEDTKKTHELLQRLIDLTEKLLAKQDATSQQPNIPAHSISPLPAILTNNPAADTLSSHPRVTIVESQAASTVQNDPEDSNLEDGDCSDASDQADSLCVDHPLKTEVYDMEGLRHHILDYSWTQSSLRILDGLVDDVHTVMRPCIFPLTRSESQADRSHLSHYSIYDVVGSGKPLETKPASNEENPVNSSSERALEIWNRIRATNVDLQRRIAMGRIVIVREPSPKTYAALHYTMSTHFDMDELLELLQGGHQIRMIPHRAYASDLRHGRTFVVVMDYATIIGDSCKPPKWQACNTAESKQYPFHVPISRCNSICALSLEGPPMSMLRNSHQAQRGNIKSGYVYDPFSPWRVLSIQQYPDWHATIDTYSSSEQYINGPEAFLYTIHAEFKDAVRRLRQVYDVIVELVDPSQEVLFSLEAQEKLLFEDKEFSNSKKWFWAYQALSIVNQDITGLTMSYHETFTQSVWEGSNKLIWPGESKISSRHQEFRKRMARVRQHIDVEMSRLEDLKLLNTKKMQNIEGLLENLSTWTNVMEARRSAQQNRSILLLTLVTIFFLPLSFVASVFGMTNMDETASYTPFAITIVTVCIPTYLIIGSLATDHGLERWRRVKLNIGQRPARFLKAFHSQREPATDDYEVHNLSSRPETA